MFKLKPHIILKLKRIAWMLLWTCLFVMFIAAYWFGFKSEAKQQCTELSVQVFPETVKFIKPKQIVELITKKGQKSKKIEGSFISSINIGQMEKKLKQLPWAQSAEVFISIDGKLSIEIQQRQPILRVEGMMVCSFI